MQISSYVSDFAAGANSYLMKDSGAMVPISFESQSQNIYILVNFILIENKIVLNYFSVEHEVSL